MLASQQPDGGISPEDAYRAHLRVGDEIHALEELGMSAASISDLGYPDPEAFIPDPEVPSDEGRERAATLSGDVAVRHETGNEKRWTASALHNYENGIWSARQASVISGINPDAPDLHDLAP
jgi:hypothetical protein